MNDNPIKQVSRLTPCQQIKIWMPRYKDRVVLIAKYKIGTHNEITFTKAKHLAGMVFYMSGTEIASHPLETNGKIPCYAVPIDELYRMERV